jgi:hypothetical protein
MTAGRAAIIKVLSIYREVLYALSQIEVQKLTYFLVQAGQDLGGLTFKKAHLRTIRGSDAPCFDEDGWCVFARCWRRNPTVRDNNIAIRA